MSKVATGPAAEEDTRSAWARVYVWAAAALLMWLLGWIWSSWPYQLDDALIHLRYADHLLHLHRITYDGVHASFGTSSLLYVSLLAGLRAVWTSPLLPRVVSSLVYLLFFGLLARVLYRSLEPRRDLPAAVWLLALALLAVTVAPSAVRWMDDGMETGLVFLDALSGVLLLRRLVAPQRLPGSMLLLGFLYGLMTVLLRVELLVLVCFVSAMAAVEMFTGRYRRMGVEHPVKALVTALVPLLGGLTGAAVIVLTMHALLPDTALAKSFGHADWQDTFHMTEITVASSFSFGVGLIVLWLLSLLLLMAGDGVRLADVPGNLLFPAVFVASAARGQQIQGIRYFGWTLFFPVLWNLLRTAEGLRVPGQGFARVLSGVIAAFLVALVPAFGWESVAFHRLFAGRISALNEFRGQHLEGLRGQLGIAEDVGFVGYFTDGDICDPYGLVNGRAAARLKYQARFDHCMSLHPVFAFGSREFLQKVTHVQSLAGWQVCGSYPFENVRSTDLHYLVVDPGDVRRGCPEGAQPVEAVLPGLV